MRGQKGKKERERREERPSRLLGVSEGERKKEKTCHHSPSTRKEGGGQTKRIGERSVYGGIFVDEVTMITSRRV